MSEVAEAVDKLIGIYKLQIRELEAEVKELQTIINEFEGAQQMPSDLTRVRAT
jgi:hypothetical protein